MNKNEKQTDIKPLLNFEELINKATEYLKYSKIKLKVPQYNEFDQYCSIAILTNNYNLDIYGKVIIALKPDGSILFLKDVTSSYITEVTQSIKGVYNYVNLTLSIDEIELDPNLSRTITLSITNLINNRLLMIAKRIHSLQNFNYQIQYYVNNI